MQVGYLVMSKICKGVGKTCSYILGDNEMTSPNKQHFAKIDTFSNQNVFVANQFSF